MILRKELKGLENLQHLRRREMAETAAGYRQTVRVAPTLRTLKERRLSRLSVSTVVSNFWAMLKSVSPDLTR